MPYYDTQKCQGCKKTKSLAEFQSGETKYVYRRCNTCRQSMKETYGDPTFRGSGKLKCYICGEPYRDHERMRLCDKPPIGDMPDRRKPR
jgi:hypothetical protein